MRRKTNLLALLLLVGCSSDDPAWYPEEIVSEPVLFAPGVVSLQEAQEFGATFTPDGSAVYFTRRIPGERQKIWVSRFESGSWGLAELAPFSDDVDENPWISPDGRRLYFATRRPGVFDQPDLSDNLWVAEGGDGTWGQPSPLRGGVNRPRPDGLGWPIGSELNPVIGPDSALYYWTQEAGESGTPDIYRSEPSDDGFGPGVPLGVPINTPAIESHAAFSPEGWLVFQAFGREDGGAGFEDLYFARRDGDRWLEPRLLGPPISTEANEGFPSFTPDGRFLFFASDRDGSEGGWSIWFVDWEAVLAGLE